MQGSITSDRTALIATESPTSSSASSSGGAGEGAGVMRRMVEESPVVVVGRRGCCMCYVARRLLLGLGVIPVVCEFGEEADRAVDVEVPGGDLRRLMTLPAVFVGGRLLGGLDRLVAVHITGELVPMLKEAGALWL